MVFQCQSIPETDSYCVHWHRIVQLIALGGGTFGDSATEASLKTVISLEAVFS